MNNKEIRKFMEDSNKRVKKSIYNMKILKARRNKIFECESPEDREIAKRRLLEW